MKTWTPRIITQSELLLTVNGAPSLRATLRKPIAKLPNDSLQIGDDLRSPVLGDRKPPPFRGLIESVRIYSGELPPTGLL